MIGYEEQKRGLALLRKPFPPHQISKLPKPTKQQTEAVKANYKVGIRCAVCGTWHHPDVIHLDYVGHAALTDRLLDADPFWSWEPFAVGPDGLPALDKNGGLWIRLTVCGVTRIGYGDAGDKTGGDATKERIGDALRNAAMRFGAALDLWHKGDLHGNDEAPQPIGQSTEQKKPPDFVGEIVDLLDDADIPIAEFCAVGKIRRIEDLHMANVESAKKWIAQKRLARKTTDLE